MFKDNNIRRCGGTTPLERSGTAIRGGLAGEARAVTTLLWVDGSPGDLHGPRQPAGVHGDWDGPTSIDGQSGEVSDGRSGLWTT